MIVICESLIALALKFLYLSFDFGFIKSNHVMVLVHLNPQNFAERGDEMVFVHDAVALQRFVIDVLSDFSKLRYGFYL
jgi:hypothetical protein